MTEPLLQIRGLTVEFAVDGSWVPAVRGADLDLARLVAERLPGATIRLAPAPHPRIRPPMGSRHQDVLGPTVWTGMDEALGHLIGKGVPA